MTALLSFFEFSELLRENGYSTLYLIHEPYRVAETRSIAEKLKRKGFTPLVAQDFREQGRKAVSDAIARSDVSVVIAFDEETLQTARASGVPFYFLHLGRNRSKIKRFVKDELEGGVFYE